VKPPVKKAKAARYAPPAAPVIPDLPVSPGIADAAIVPPVESAAAARRQRLADIRKGIRQPGETG